MDSTWLPQNLLYMTRLGLWGPSTAFPCRLDFVKLLNARGVGAMELVALDLKRRGAFMARTLSWEGVEVRRVRTQFVSRQLPCCEKTAIW